MPDGKSKLNPILCLTFLVLPRLIFKLSRNFLLLKNNTHAGWQEQIDVNNLTRL